MGEEVIIKIDLEQDDGDFKKLADLKGTLIGLKTEQKELQKALKDGAITQKEYNAEIVRVEALQKRAQAQYSQTQRSVTGLKNPINELNNTIQKQNALLGGAIPALDKMTGGAASAAQGIYGMVRASIAFIATPIGAVVAALGLAIGALTAYFKGSEEGQDRLAVITTTLSVAFNKLMVVVEAIGETIFDTTTGIAGLTQKWGLLGVALDISLAPLKLFLAGLQKISEFTGLDEIIQDTIKVGEAIASANDKIEADENVLIVKRAQINAEVQALREKAIKQEGALKKATIEEAINLEKGLAQEEKKQLEAKLAAFDLEAATTGKLTEEQKKKRAELSAAIINAESQGAQATIKFQKEVERLRDEANAKEQKRIDENIKAKQKELEAKKKIAAEEIRIRQELVQAEQEQVNNNLNFLKQKEDEKILVAKVAFEQGVIDKEEYEELISGIEIAALEERKAFLIANGEDTLEIDTAIVDARIKNAEREKSAKAKINSELINQERQKLTNAKVISDAANAITKRGTLAYQATASAQAFIDTYAGATAATKPPPIGLGPIAGIPLAILTVIRGLQNVAKINGIGFARGGYTGHGGVYEPAGIVHKGEVVWSQADVAAYGGATRVDRMRPTYGYATGGIVGNETRSATLQANSQIDLNQLSGLLNQIQTVLVLEQFEAKQNSVNQVQQRAVVIQ